MADERTYGFNRDDATALIQSISHSESWFPEIKPRGGGTGGTHEIWFTIISVECVSATEMILTVNPTWYTGGCDAAIPDADSYGYVTVEDVCEILLFYTAEWLVGKTGRATYMYPRTGTCTPKWLVDVICGTPECA
jgi:hypothetical protein